MTQPNECGRPYVAVIGIWYCERMLDVFHADTHTIPTYLFIQMYQVHVAKSEQPMEYIEQKNPNIRIYRTPLMTNQNQNRIGAQILYEIRPH